MKFLRNRIPNYFFYALTLIECILIAFIGIQKHMDVSFENDSLYSLNDGWTYSMPYAKLYNITLPTTLDTKGNQTVILYRTLPENLERTNCIGILTTNQSLTAYLDGQKIYERKVKPDELHFFNVPSGTVYDIIMLPRELSGKTLTLEINSRYSDHAEHISGVYAGTRSSLLFNSILLFGAGFLFSIIFFFLGLCMMVIHSFIKRLIHANRSLYYLGWFTLIISLWFLMESNLTQLFISNEYLISAITYLSLMSVPIPALFYFSDLENFHFQKLTTVLIYIMLINNAILITLQFFNILDFQQTLGFLRIMISLILTISVFTLWLDYLHFKNTQIRIFVFSATLLLVFAVLELLNFQSTIALFTGEIFRLGFILFLITLSLDAMRKAVDVIRLSEKADQYKLLATRDPLSNCRSRAAYERDLPRIDLSKNVTLFMADMNNMKQINDTFGHQVGDEVIILCSQCLMKIFGRRVYRIGGDEFVCLEYDMTPQLIEYMLAAFVAECTKVNEDIPYKFAMSVGYATYDKDLDQTIYDTVKRADQKMYEAKEKAHE